LIIVLLGVNCFGQDTTFTFTKDGFTDYVIGVAENKTEAELYKKTLDWISVTYNNPKEVIKAQIENDYIRIEGSDNTFICTNMLGMKLCYLSKYQIEISFKEGKYKFDVVNIQSYSPASQSQSGYWFNVEFNDTNVYYKKSGEIKSPYKNYPLLIPMTFNTLNNSLKDFLNSNNTSGKKNDW
jgi:hypothetical protein